MSPNNAMRSHFHRLRRPKRDEWTIELLQEHLQFAVDLEFWTIPFYMSAMYSIEDPSSEAYRLVKSVVNQEMLHMQLAANLANAYGAEVEVRPPIYGEGVPHLDFSLDDPDPTLLFFPWDSQIGPFDVPRLNAMCLIEWPDGPPPDRDPHNDTYGSIGQFYHSVAVGARQLRGDIVGGRNQVDLFQHFYPNFKQPTVTKDGPAGLIQVRRLINAIVSQGEGKSRRFEAEEGMEDYAEATTRFIPSRFQNLADDIQPAWDHYEKFIYLKKQPLPSTHAVTDVTTPQGQAEQERLVVNFGRFCAQLQSIFRGGSISDFGPLMFTLGGNILSCWKAGATPKFNGPRGS